MKQKMKSLVSIIALVLMMVSMFSVFAFPASAANNEDEYSTLQAGALVVNAAWSDKSEGDSVSYTYRGKEITEPFDSEWHFASFEDAWAYAASKGRTNPAIMICGNYSKEIQIQGAVTIIGADAGIDPVAVSAAKNLAWSRSEKFTGSSVISGSIVVANNAGDANITIDGVVFGAGGAYIDKFRSSGSSELSLKNVVFDGAGNAASSSFALQLTSAGHARSVVLENAFITNQNSEGFLSPYYHKFVAKHVAYVNNSKGIISKSFFASGVSPYLEFSDCCFYNAGLPGGAIISVDNADTGYVLNNGSQAIGTIGTSAERPSSVLSINDCIFYNASSASGLIHYEFINKNSTISMENNYIYSSDATSVLHPEFLVDSVNIDQTSCMNIENNILIGAYMIPDVSAGHVDTRIDMSYNFFGNQDGQCVERPVYVNPVKPRLIRTAYWINEEMTVPSNDPMWDISVKDWDMYQVDAFNLEVVMTAFEETGVTEFLPKFVAAGGSKVQLYKKADDINGRYVNLSEPVDQLTLEDLKADYYEPSVIYAQITNSSCDYFAPVYKIVLESVGSIDDAPYFSKEVPGYYMYQPTVFNNASGSVVPYRWQNKIYKFEVGKTLFADFEKLIAYAKSKGHAVPNVVIPAGVYTDDIIISGSCNVLGEKHGVDPNVVVADKITKENASTSGWTLNPERSNDKFETIVKDACLRVSASANDYVITIDGIKMSEGCSYVDDEARKGGITNVTIFRNVIADGAGGGATCTGADNTYLFNFNKPYLSATDFDYAYVYMYDCRIVRNQKCHVFGPFIEKLIVDHTYFGDAKLDPTENKNFLQNFRSRAAYAPYFGLTNNCFYNNEKSSTNSDGLTGTYILNCKDDASDVGLKKNIIYNLDNNYCWNGFGASNGGFQIYHCGSTMKFIMTNNIMISSNIKGNDTFMAGNRQSRWSGDSASYDCSDCLIVKGNHIIGRTQLPHTGGTGKGTLIDYSGNYYATTLTGDAMLPKQLVRASGEDYATYGPEEYYVRYTVDYTYLDWDMTKRSDDENYNAAGYALNRGMYGTGTYAEKEFGGVTTMVFEDMIPADCAKYEIPATLAPNCKTKVAKQGSDGKFGTASTATTLAPYADESIFRVDVTSPSNTVSFIVKLTRKVNDKAQVLSIGGTGVASFVDEEAGVIYIHTNKEDFAYDSNLVKVSNGATQGFFKDEACRESATVTDLTVGTVVTRYLKVTAQDRVHYQVYKVKLTRYDDANPIDLAVIKSIAGMTYVGNNTFEAPVDEWYPEFSFKPTLYQGAKADVYRGNNKLSLSSNKYNVDNIKDGETLRVVVTAADGVTTENYTIRFVYEAGNKTELLAIKDAITTDSGFYWNLGYATAAELKATVSEGATYQAYADINMQQAFENNIVIIPEGTGSTIFVKVTAANGKDTTVYAVPVVTQGNVLQKAEFTVKAGKKTYPAYITGQNEYTAFLPVGVKNVTIDSSKANNAFLYGDPLRSIAFSDADKIRLDQKITNVYFTINDGAYRQIEHSDGTFNVRNPEIKGVLKIVSDRKAVAYKDANKIASWAVKAANGLNMGGYGIVKGDGNNNFNGSAAITRYEIAAIAVRMMGLDVNRFESYQLPYADKIDSWALPYVKAVTASGIMSGTTVNGKDYFNGKANATREQVAKIMSNVVMISEGYIDPTSLVSNLAATANKYYKTYANDIDLVFDEYQFKDLNKVSKWATPYMHMAVYLGLMEGSKKAGSFYLNPKATITRAEVAQMVANYMFK